VELIASIKLIVSSAFVLSILAWLRSLVILKISLGRLIENDITKSSVEFSAIASSIDTGVAARDNHLRTADFFDVEKYPQISFKSTKVEKKGNEYLITGDLTIKGITKQISFPFQITGFIASDPRG